MWALQVVLLSFIALTGVAGQMTAMWRDSVVDEHNKARSTLAIPSASNMNTLVYNMSMEAIAQKYLDATYPDGCPSGLEHNPNRGDFGENWYSGQPITSDSDAGATAAWTTEAILVNKLVGTQCSERDNFYSLNGCPQAPCYNADGTFNPSWNTGHFTQVMWAATAQIGCGYKSGCGTLCNYYPSGNWNLPNGILSPSDIWKTTTPGISHSTPKKLQNRLFHQPLTTTSLAPITTTTTTTPAPTTTSNGDPCYAANDPILTAQVSPTSTFLTQSLCSRTFNSNCQVCGIPFSVQSGSTQLTVAATISCPGVTITYAFPAFLNVLGWSVTTSVSPRLSSLPSAASTVQYVLQSFTPPGNATIQAEWCVNGQYAAFPMSVMHTS